MAVGEAPVALHQGPLTDFVPAAGLRWMIAGSPAYFARHPALGSLRGSWWSEERARAFIEATGIDLARTERALVAGFDLGTLYIVDSSGWAAAPELRFAERLAGSERTNRPHPQIWHVTGVVGSVPESLVRVSDDLVAIAVSDLLPARLVDLRARGRLKRWVSALGGAALSTLPKQFLEPGPCLAYALGPFDGAPLGDSRGLLSAATALAASLDVGDAHAELRLALAGHWDPEQDPKRLSALWGLVANSADGRLLGLSSATVSVEPNATADHLFLHVVLPLPPLLRGLESLVSRDLQRLLGETGAAGPSD